jgi:hypothetical protein
MQGERAGPGVQRQLHARLRAEMTGIAEQLR